MNAKKQKSIKEKFYEQYNRLIEELDIEDIKLGSAKIENLDDSYFPQEAKVDMKFRADYENTEAGFNVSQEFRTKISENKVSKARITVKFLIKYSSEVEMDDELFELFKEKNLLINSWPYYREFVHNAVQRMGWPPYIVEVYRA